MEPGVVVAVVLPLALSTLRLGDWLFVALRMFLACDAGWYLSKNNGHTISGCEGAGTVRPR